MNSSRHPFSVRAWLLACCVVSTLSEPTLAWAAEPEPAPTAPFELDAITEVAVLLAAGSMAGFTELVVRSNALLPAPALQSEKLLAIDRWLAERDGPVDGAGQVSDALAITTGALLVADAAATWFDAGGNEGLVDLTLYAESVLLNWGLSNVVKLGVRRPRPRAYWAARQPSTEAIGVDEALSFYSLHTAFTAGMAATATYVSFARDRAPWRSWTTLGVGLALTSAVGVNRMLAGAHFPSDVLAGALIGTSLGVLVPHLHRREDVSVALFGTRDAVAISVGWRF